MQQILISSFDDFQYDFNFIYTDDTGDNRVANSAITVAAPCEPTLYGYSLIFNAQPFNYAYHKYRIDFSNGFKILISITFGDDCRFILLSSLLVKKEELMFLLKKAECTAKNLASENSAESPDGSRHATKTMKVKCQMLNIREVVFVDAIVTFVNNRKDWHLHNVKIDIPQHVGVLWCQSFGRYLRQLNLTKGH